MLFGLFNGHPYKEETKPQTNTETNAHHPEPGERFGVLATPEPEIPPARPEPPPPAPFFDPEEHEQAIIRQAIEDATPLRVEINDEIPAQLADLASDANLEPEAMALFIQEKAAAMDQRHEAIRTPAFFRYAARREFHNWTATNRKRLTAFERPQTTTAALPAPPANDASQPCPTCNNHGVVPPMPVPWNLPLGGIWQWFLSNNLALCHCDHGKMYDYIVPDADWIAPTE